ncbi:MAG: C25 family cysteine peptidase, partial [Candidatus Thorarchaeota archaeon]|nr:C25 family cysteine peptidase [Candidatus Thorarchaeota archaeon]
MNETQEKSITLMVILSLLILYVLPMGIQTNQYTEFNPSYQTLFMESDIPEDSVPLSRATLVSYDPDSYLDDFAYMAAVPSSLFYYGGVRYTSPLLFTGGSLTEQWLIEDWNEYLSADGGIADVIAVGEFTDSEIQKMQDNFAAEIYPRITGATSADIAAKLAVNDWQSADTVVLALSKDSFAQPSYTSGEFSHVFASPSVQSYDGTTTISDNLPHNIAFTPPAGTGWLEGAFNWTGSEYFTHILKDPQDRPVDYSIASQVFFERAAGLYVDSPLPLYFWVPMTESGEWTMTLDPYSQVNRAIEFEYQIKYHPGFTETITVPQGAKWLNVTATWDNAGTNVHFALVDPDGRLVMWAPAEGLLGGAGSKSMQMPYPMIGDWTFIGAWTDAVQENNNVDVVWEMETLPLDLQPHLESASNAAVIASLLNAPLLYVNSDSIPASTLWAIEHLGATSGIMVDPSNIHSASLTTELNDVLLLSNISTYAMMTDWIQTFSGEEDIVLTVPLGNGDELFGPSAYSAAFHGAAVFSLCGDDNLVPTRSEETWAPYLIGPEINVFVQPRYSTRTENGWYDERIPNRYSMSESANYVIDFLDSRNAYNASSDQTAVIVSPTDLIKISFDRSLQSHFACGRIPGENGALAAAMVNKAVHHRFLFSTADKADEALLSFYAYTIDSSYSNNYGNPVTIRQIDDTEAALTGAGITINSHVGVDEVFQGVASQVGLWSFSTHGTLTQYPTDPPQRPNGLGIFSLRDDDIAYGQETSTERDHVPEGEDHGDGLVNPVIFDPESTHHVIKNTNDLEAAVGNIGSPIVVVTACLLGGSRFPTMLMEHGAVAVTAAPRTVYFRPAGLLSILFIESITDGNTTGDALAQALRAISLDYTDPISEATGDYANQQILFGDPDICYYTPSSHQRIPSVVPSTLSFDGHSPSNGVDDVAGVGQSTYLPQAFIQTGIEYDYYENSNYSDFLMLLDLRTTVILEPSSLSILEPIISANVNALSEFVYKGGTLVIPGINVDVSWLPWDIIYSAEASSTGLLYTDATHPLITLPHTLSEDISYTGFFSSRTANLSVLSTGNGNDVFIAGMYGNGKVALTTTNPSGNDAQEFVENAIAWNLSPSLSLRDIHMNQEITWEGDVVIITLTITDSVGLPVDAIDLTVWINDTEISTETGSGGEYTVTLDGGWTTGKGGMHSISIHAQKSGYDTLSLKLVNFLFIRTSPWLAIIIVGGAIAAVVVGWQYRKYRRGEPLRGTREKPSKPRPARKESKDDRMIRKKEEEACRKQ